MTEAASDRRGGRSLRIRPRRSIAGQPEGRWSRLGDPANDPEGRLLAWAGCLLERYGVLTREMAALDPSAPSWGELAPILARAEWRGEVRRGYFVEGLSGVQYATEEAAAELARLVGTARAITPVILVSTVDPANLYGAGAPLDVELLDGGVARLPRDPGNFLAIRRRTPRPDRRSLRQTPDRTPLGLPDRHRFRAEASHHFNRARSTHPEGRIV